MLAHRGRRRRWWHVVGVHQRVVVVVVDLRLDALDSHNSRRTHEMIFEHQFYLHYSIHTQHF